MFSLKNKFNTFLSFNLEAYINNNEKGEKFEKYSNAHKK